MRKPIIKKGDKYNRLTAVKFVYKYKKDGKNRQYWLFKCDCGNEKVIRVDGVKGGQIKSCGCLAREINMKRMTTHGMADTRIYKTWITMKDRCFNKNNPEYKNYGGRGITVCKRWLKFENFYKDMGDRPIGKSIDRIDNNGNYCPENCRWATPKQQANNMRSNRLLTYQEKTQTVSQWAEKFGLSCNRIYQRLNSGWSVKKTLETPVGN